MIGTFMISFDQHCNLFILIFYKFLYFNANLVLRGSSLVQQVAGISWFPNKRNILIFRPKKAYSCKQSGREDFVCFFFFSRLFSHVPWFCPFVSKIPQIRRSLHNAQYKKERKKFKVDI